MMTQQAAILSAWDAIIEERIPGRQLLSRGGAEEERERVVEDGEISVRFEQAWSVSCDLYVAVRKSGLVVVSLTWSSTARDVGAAVAAIALYGRVAALAALIETKLRLQKIEKEVPADDRAPFEKEAPVPGVLEMPGHLYGDKAELRRGRGSRKGG